MSITACASMGMAAAMNGIALHGGFIPYGGTFLVFADYCRPAIRLAALMRLRVIHVMTHDSISLGRDGPTHQPVEHLLRCARYQNLLVFRPCDATGKRWRPGTLRVAIRDEPFRSFCLSRQAPDAFVTAGDINLVARGACHVVVEPEEGRDVTLMATGSELAIALDAAKLVAKKDDIRAAVVTGAVLRAVSAAIARISGNRSGKCSRVSVEAMVESEWARWLGAGDDFVGMTGFSASAPAAALYREFGITAVPSPPLPRVALPERG